MRSIDIFFFKHYLFLFGIQTSINILLYPVRYISNKLKKECLNHYTSFHFYKYFNMVNYPYIERQETKSKFSTDEKQKVFKTDFLNFKLKTSFKVHSLHQFSFHCLK